METPKKPAKKTSAKKATDNAPSPNQEQVYRLTMMMMMTSLMRPIDDLGAYDQFDGLEEEEDYDKSLQHYII